MSRSGGYINNIVHIADDLARRHGIDEQVTRILEELTGECSFFGRYVPFLEVLIASSKCNRSQVSTDLQADNAHLRRAGLLSLGRMMTTSLVVRRIGCNLLV